MAEECDEYLGTIDLSVTVGNKKPPNEAANCAKFARLFDRSLYTFQPLDRMHLLREKK